jgi:hypothetical protein
MDKDLQFNFRLTKAQKTRLLKRAALMTVNAGKRITMTDLLLNALEQLVSAPMADEQSAVKGTETIKFIPTPDVAKALKRAQANSGKPIGTIVNQLVIEALQVEVNP